MLSLLHVTNVVAVAIPESAGHNLEERDCLRGLHPAGDSKRRVMQLEMRSDPDDDGAGAGVGGGPTDPGDSGDHNGGGDGGEGGH